MSTGNLVPSTAAKGVNFTANTAAAGMTSQLLNWYEEGTWTPTIIGTTTSGVGVYTTQTGKYTRIGRAVNFYCLVVWVAHTGTGNMQIGTLPFTSANDGAFTPAAGRGDPVTISASNIQTFSVLPNNTLIRPYMTPVGGAASSLTPITVSGTFVVSGTYYIS
jgi:hypothetical protein